MENRPVPLHADNPGPLTGAGNTTWLIDGAEPTLVDAGVGKAAHVDAIAAALGGRALARVLVTHDHADHAAGVPALRARWPAIDARKFLIDTDTGSDTAAPWRALADGEQVRAGDTMLIVLHTPGHARDHVCFWDPAAAAVFSGDMLIEGTTVMIPASRGGGLRAYLASLERIAALRPVRAYPGHGGPIEQPIELINVYLEHRRLREAQVLACLRDGIIGVDAMVARIYPGLAEPLIGPARATVEAHLEKLREDGAIG